MATTIPNVIRTLGNKQPDGFTKDELIEELIKAGYGPEKAVRRFKQCAASKQIVPSNMVDAQTNKTLWISIYCQFHWKQYKEILEPVRIVPVHIERDGSITFLV